MVCWHKAALCFADLLVCFLSVVLLSRGFFNGEPLDASEDDDVCSCLISVVLRVMMMMMMTMTMTMMLMMMMMSLEL